MENLVDSSCNIDESQVCWDAVAVMSNWVIIILWLHITQNLDCCVAYHCKAWLMHVHSCMCVLASGLSRPECVCWAAEVVQVQRNSSLCISGAWWLCKNTLLGSMVTVLYRISARIKFALLHWIFCVCYEWHWSLISCKVPYSWHCVFVWLVINFVLYYS